MDTSRTEKKKRAYEIFTILKKLYPDARPLLNHKNPFELLVATILAAQCTDERVNEVTGRLFTKYRDPSSLANAPQAELEVLIRPTGFFKSKAKSLIGASRTMIELFGGKIPESIDDLVRLPGVGRKTANVVAGNCFGIPAIIVDTHLKRLAGRLELSDERDPDKIEMELRGIVDPKDTTRFSHVVNFHGRYVCQARKPLCPKCAISHLCPYPVKTV
jgi:endonuclease-3